MRGRNLIRTTTVRKRHKLIFSYESAVKHKLDVTVCFGHFAEDPFLKKSTFEKCSSAPNLYYYFYSFFFFFFTFFFWGEEVGVVIL